MAVNIFFFNGIVAYIVQVFFCGTFPELFFCLLFELFSVPFSIDIGIPFSLVCKYRKWLVAYLIYFTQAGLLNSNIAVFRA